MGLSERRKRNKGKIMILTSIEKLAKEIGFDIGNSNDEVQGDLLNGFCKALTNSMKPYDKEKQICYMVDKLDKNAMDTIKIIYEFIELKYKI
jgi:hypothetical protein